VYRCGPYRILTTGRGGGGVILFKKKKFLFWGEKGFLFCFKKRNKDSGGEW